MRKENLSILIIFTLGALNSSSAIADTTSPRGAFKAMPNDVLNYVILPKLDLSSAARFSRASKALNTATSTDLENRKRSERRLDQLEERQLRREFRAATGNLQINHSEVKATDLFIFEALEQGRSGLDPNRYIPEDKRGEYFNSVFKIGPALRKLRPMVRKISFHQGKDIDIAFKDGSTLRLACPQELREKILDRVAKAPSLTYLISLLGNRIASLPYLYNSDSLRYHGRDTIDAFIKNDRFEGPVESEEASTTSDKQLPNSGSNGGPEGGAPAAGAAH